MEAGEGRDLRPAGPGRRAAGHPGIPRDGYYAFVCEKCAPAFDYYGYFADAEEAAKKAESIYERA